MIINDLSKQYETMKKVSIQDGDGENWTTTNVQMFSCIKSTLENLKNRDSLPKNLQEAYQELFDVDEDTGKYNI